jgi:ABC-type multidrug transport system permease subunit
VVALVGFGWLLFHVAVRGSFLTLAGITILGAFAFAGLGLLVASRAKTIEGVSGLMNLVMLPMWIFSGVFFSASRFPDAIQPLIRALPLTAVINALRASMLQGASLRAIALELAVITAWLVVSFPLALRIFRWK